MTSQFDITALPLYRSEGIEHKVLPGLQVFNPPRRPARGRKNDRLLLYLQLDGNVRLSREKYIELLDSAGKVFYGTSGAVTAALRSTAEAVNDVILAHNMRGGQPLVGVFNAIVVREDQLYIAQSGPAHSFLLAAGSMEYFHDAEAAGRGLGVGRSPTIRYFQAPLSQGALFVTTPKVPKSWSADTVRSAVGQSMAGAARRFMADAGADLTAIVLEARAGQGGIKLLTANTNLAVKEAPRPQPASTEPPIEETPAPAAPHAGAPQPSRSDAPAQPSRSDAAPAGEPAPKPLARPAALPAETARPRQPRPAPTRQPAPEGFTPLDDSLPEPASGPGRLERIAERLGPAASTTGQRLQSWGGQAARWSKTALDRVLPTEESLNLPGWVMGFIAVIVPIIVVLIAVIVYTNIGRDQLYANYLEQAQAAAAQAEAQGTGAEARGAWQQTIALLDYTEQYQITDETTILRQRAESVLDQLDGVRRITFTESINGVLSPQIEIRQLAANSTDLYMLDINSGSVLRATQTAIGYAMDANFRCGPGSYGAFIVGPLIDMVVLSKFNPEGATVLAIDANGNLLYCIPDDLPNAVQLTPPDVLWGEPKAIAIDDGDLYVLDPLTNAVWIYTGIDESFVEPPTFFFAAEVPPLGTAIDIAVNGADLWVLHSDGRTTHCVYSGLNASPTDCDDPVIFDDPRAGYTDGPLVEGARFYQVQRTLPPEPSVFFLDPITRSIYHYSLQLRLSAQYRAADDLPEGLATAFTISPGRMIFIAMDNQVFSSPLP